MTKTILMAAMMTANVMAQGLPDLNVALADAKQDAPVAKLISGLAAK